MTDAKVLQAWEHLTSACEALENVLRTLARERSRLVRRMLDLLDL